MPVDLFATHKSQPSPPFDGSEFTHATIEKESLYAISKNKERIKIVSKERISDELNNHMITYRGKEYTPTIISRLIKTHNIIPKKSDNVPSLYLSFAKNKHLKRESVFNNNRFTHYGNITFSMINKIKNLNINNAPGSITELE